MISTETPQPAKRSSLRQKAFGYFDVGWRPAAVANLLNAKPATIFRYFQDWKELPTFFHLKYRVAQRVNSRLSPSDRRVLTRWLAAELLTSEDAIRWRLSTPWALRQLVSGDWRHWPVPRNQAAGSVRRKLALDIQLRRGSPELGALVWLIRHPNYNPFHRE